MIATYLNDHLAIAAAAPHLTRRALGSNRGSELGAFLEALLPEIEDDLRQLTAVMRLLGVGQDPVKRLAGVAAERLGRLKPNGRLIGYSPLSRLVELDALAAIIEAQKAMWIVLSELPDPRLPSVDLEALVERAGAQRAELEPHRLAAARRAFTRHS
jgi:hypothetical protein